MSEIYKTHPNFQISQNDIQDNYYCGGRSTLALTGIAQENSPLSKLYFSNENVKRIQANIKRYIWKLSKGKFKMDIDQDESDLLISMRAIFLENCKFIPINITQQLNELNKKTLIEIIPDMITNIKQQYTYIKTITNPINPIDLPLGVGSRGRKTLPSTTDLWSNPY